MRALLFVLMVSMVMVCVEGKSALRGMFPPTYPMMKKDGVDPGQPVFLTPFVEKGMFDEAQAASKVGPIKGVEQDSYAGFFTVNKTTNSNMYFWFWPAQNNSSSAPVVLWLQGGPGGSSLFGMFVENGPYSIDSNYNFVRTPYTWNSKYSMLYIDNPVGTGFSFTDMDAGYATNEVDVGRDLYSCIYQFFQVFYQLKDNAFYATGESYAGKYVPAIAYKIHQENMNPFTKMKINLVGLAIGDGLCDPETMMPQYADFMYNIGMLDESERDFFQGYAKQAVGYIQNKEFGKAFDIIFPLLLSEDNFLVNVSAQHTNYNYLRSEIFDFLLNGDLYPYKPYFYNVTNTDNYYNFLETEEPVEFGYYGPVLADPVIRKAINVGNLTYHDGTKVEKHLINDVMDTVKPWVAVLMDNYRVMMYTGQLDIIVAIPLTEAFLMTVEWSGQEQYKKAGKLIWRINPDDKEVAGYVRQVNDFYQVIVRGGGHILPFDQPARSFDMIDRFIQKKGFF